MERIYDTIVKTFLEAASHGIISVIQEAIKEYNINIMAINGDHDNALILAALNGHLDMIEYLLSRIPQADQKECIESGNQLGITPIIAACASGNLKILIRLLKVYKNEDVIEMPVTDMGNTCLGIACANGHLNIVKFLVTYGFGLQPVEGSLCPHPLMLAMINGHEPILSYFYLPSLARTPAKLCLYSTEDQEQICQYDSPHAANIPTVNIDECYPQFHNLNILALAIVINNREMFNILLGFGASLDAILTNTKKPVRFLAETFNFDISTMNGFESSSGTQSINSSNAASEIPKKSRKSMMKRMTKLFKNNNH